VDKSELYAGETELKEQFNEKIDASIRFIPLGGGNEVSCSSFLFSFDDIHILVDCGVRYNSKKRYPDYSYLTRLLGSWSKIQAVLVTHSHMDHCGAILPIMQNLPSEKIYTTIPTREILERILPFQLEFESEIIDDETLNNEIKLLKTSLFNEKIKLISEISFFKPLTFTSRKRGTVLEVIPVPSGHILGSSGFLFKYVGKTIFFSSDYQPQQQYSIGQKPYIPEQNGLDCIILDGTNFYMPTQSLPLQRKEQEKFIIESVSNALNQHQLIVFPTQATGHAQELIKIIDNAMLNGSINTVPVFLDGFINEVLKIYRKEFRRQKSDFCSSNVQNRAKDMRIEDILTFPTIIITTSKNFLKSNSRSYDYVSHISNKNLPNLIMSQFDPSAPHTFTKLSLDMQNLLLNLNAVPFRLETHISAKDSINLILKLKPTQVILTHSIVRSSISRSLEGLHPLDFPKNCSVIQSINNMPIYI